jgi:hypothetical protein
MKNNLRVFTKEHREKISKKRKELYASGAITTWSKGKTMTKDHCLKNMKAHLKYDVSLEWLNSFEDIEKLKCLNGAIKRKRDYEGFTTDTYKAYIEKFYNDKKFNELFDKWKETSDKWIKPSLDHIVPKAKKGSLLLDNLQFISWLENRAKIDIGQDEWTEIKRHINYYI